MLRELRRTAGRSHGGAAPRARCDRRHQLLPLLRLARRAVPCARVRPPRPRRGDPHSPPVPPRRLRRRRRGHGRCPGHRPVHPGRLLDGRRRRPARVEAAPSARQRHRPVRDGDHFNGTATEQLNFLSLGGLAALARLTPAPVRRSVADRYRRDRHADWAQWARDQTLALGLAGGARGRRRPRPVPLRHRGSPGLDVPAAVVVTTARLDRAGRAANAGSPSCSPTSSCSASTPDTTPSSPRPDSRRRSSPRSTRSWRAPREAARPSPSSPPAVVVAAIAASRRRRRRDAPDRPVSRTSRSGAQPAAGAHRPRRRVDVRLGVGAQAVRLGRAPRRRSTPNASCAPPSRSPTASAR